MSDRRIEWAMATICCDGFGDEDFAFAFEHMPQLGVRNVEFNCWYARNLTPAGIASLAARCAANELRPVSLHVPGFVAGSPGELAREVARWSWLVEAARRLGVSMLKATGSARGTGGGTRGLIDILRHIAPIAGEHGIRIALENHFDNVIEFPADYDEIFAAIPDSNVGMCLDTGHFAASRVDPLAVIERFHDRIIHVDLKDCREPGADSFVPFGDGIVDFPAVLGALDGVGYSGYLIVEFPRRDLGEMHIDLRKGIALAESIAS